MFQKKAAASDPVAFIKTRLKIELTETKMSYLFRLQPIKY